MFRRLKAAECSRARYVPSRLRRGPGERQLAVLYGVAGHGLPVEADVAVGDVFEAHNHAQGRGLPAAGGPDEHEGVAV